MAISIRCRLSMALWIPISLFCVFKIQKAAAQEPGITRDDVSVTILTTNLADGNLTQGEWSFSAWLEVGDRRFLFDTGWSPDNVLRNAEILGIDLSA
ncbi:MAG: hypothetical protein HKN84_06530, partial [Gammaproteobacteria bacterium]|nr:hypothetical protein [Gammaproteobacteria bacterium]